MKKYLLFILVAFYFSANAQTVLWQKTYSDNYRSIVSQNLNSTGDLFFAGGADNIYQSTAYGSSDVYVQKNNSDGDTVWRRYLGGNRFDEISDMLTNEDGGVTVVTKSNSNGGLFDSHYGPEKDGSNPNYDIYISKLTDAGILWNKIIGGSGQESDAKIIKYNSGYLLAVTTTSKDYDFTNPNNSKKDVWILSLSESGDLIWKTRLLGSEDDTLANLKILNGEITVLVNSKSSDGIFSADNSTNVQKGYLIVLDAAGNITKSLQVTTSPVLIVSSGNDTYVKDAAYSNGKYAILSREANSQGPGDIITSAYTETGILLWKKTMPLDPTYFKKANTIFYQNNEVLVLSSTYLGYRDSYFSVYAEDGEVIKENRFAHGVSDAILFPNNSLCIARYDQGQFSGYPYYYGLYLISSTHELLSNKDIRNQIPSNGNFFINKINDNEIYASYAEFSNTRIVHINKVSLEGILLSAKEMSNALKITIFPNPATDIINLSKKADQVLLLSSDGRLINTFKNVQNIEVGILPIGIYYLKALFGNQVKVFRFIKK